MKDFLSIKEFSKLSGVESSTLRYWDEIGLFSPAQRDTENNYRYYSPEQIVAVNFITILSRLDIPLKIINEAGVDRNPESIMRLIEHQEKQLDMEMRRLRENYSIIHTRRELINHGKRIIEGVQLADGTMMGVDQIVVVPQEEQHLIVGPRNEFKEEGDFYEPLKCFYEQAKDLRITLGFPIGALHDTWEEFVKAPGMPHHFFSIDPTGNTTYQPGKYVMGFTFGGYGQFGDLPERMIKFIQDNSLTVTGPVYVVYLQDEICIQDSSKYLAQVSVAVSES